MRTLRLRPGQCLRVPPAATLRCCAGSVWVEPYGVLLTAGQALELDGRDASIVGNEGMRDEWLNDSGVIVVSLW